MMFAHNTEEVIESDEYGAAVFNAEVIHLEVDNLFTLKTVNMCTKRVAEGWADGGPCSLQKHLPSSTVPVYCQTVGLSKACAQVSTNSLEFAQIKKC